MKKLVFLSMLLLALAQESDASVMQFSYEAFNAPISPTNFPVDMTGVVSFAFDSECEDVDLDAASGVYHDPITGGSMFLSGVMYDIDLLSATKFTTNFNDSGSGNNESIGSFTARGTITNNDLGRTWSFYLSLFGSRSNDSLVNDGPLNLLDFNVWDRHLLVYDDSAALYESYEGGFTQIVAVPEPSSLMLMVIGLVGVTIIRFKKAKNLIRK